MPGLTLLVALLALLGLVWLGMAVSTATLLRRAAVPGPRAWAASLLAWPLVLRRLRELDDETDGQR